MMTESQSSTPTPTRTPIPSVTLGESERTAYAKTLPEAPLAWFEIESATFGEFKQVVRVPFYKGQVITIGRDAKTCKLRFQSKSVSPIHCEIYSILFDKDANYPPLIYVRDCQSESGTFVNECLIGQKPYVTAARLLQNNDVISVGPCSLRLCDYVVPENEASLTPYQQEEALQFSEQFLIENTILGSGAFAIVHLATNAQTKKQVVCKIHDLSYLKGIYDETLNGHHDTTAQRVEREISIWSQLDHPNILAFHRAFQTNNTMFTFGDLATGGDLYSVLVREKSIPELEIKWILLQVLRAVDYLHSKGVAHRDIKPENILCSSSVHLQHRIVLADFGCAGVISFNRLTSNVGTDTYRAPEIGLSSKPHGIAVDIWAVGVLILQLVSGDNPVNIPEKVFTAKQIEDLVVSVNLRRIGQKNGPVSQNGIDFILACLNHQPFARPTASGAAKHAWLRESAEEVQLFKEREKQLSWKPRDIIIPAVVRLPEIVSRSANGGNKRRDAEDEEAASSLEQSRSHRQPDSSQVIPDSAQNSQKLMGGVKRLHSAMVRQSTAVV